MGKSDKKEKKEKKYAHYSTFTNYSLTRMRFICHRSKSKKRHHSSSDEEGAAYREHRKTQKKAEKVRPCCRYHICPIRRVLTTAEGVLQVAKAFGYSNDINPFGDSNLLKPFVWGKKQEKEKQAGMGCD